jgi:hypothetical protein
LENALKSATVDYVPLVDAIYWLESYIVLEGNRTDSLPTSFLKNLGLAHVNLVQSKLLPNSKSVKIVPASSDMHGSLSAINWPSSSDRYIVVTYILLYLCYNHDLNGICLYM